MPNGAGQLLAPAALFDPRVPELLALLDPEAAFPALELASDGGALAALQRLGMRTAAGVMHCAFGGFECTALLVTRSGCCGAKSWLLNHHCLITLFWWCPKRLCSDLRAVVGAARYIEATAAKPDGAEEALARGKVGGRYDPLHGAQHGGNLGHYTLWLRKVVP